MPLNFQQLCVVYIASTPGVGGGEIETSNN